MSLKVIIAGAGKAGSELHLNAYRRVSDVEVIALCDPDLNRVKSIAKDKNIPDVFPSLEQALKKVSADIVSVCTPPSTHFEICRTALEKRCNVLVEKPIFQSLEESGRIKEIIDQTGCKFSAVHNQKYVPGIRQGVQLMRDGYIGKVAQIHSVWMINGDKNRMTEDPNFWCHKLPGGRWEEVIAHPIYKAYQFMGPMRFIHLEMKQVYNRWPWLPADELEIILEGKPGYVSIKLSANTEKYNFMLVYGSERVLYVTESTATDLLWKIHQADSPRKMLEKLFKNPIDMLRRIKSRSQHQDDGHTGLIRDFVAYVRGERSEPPVDWQEAANTHELVLQIGKEIEKRKSALK
jgi:predicted dehydrogenase